MNILVVDDDFGKFRLIRDYLISIGVEEDRIFSVEHASGARLFLERNSVDILLIDVLIPARKGAMPRGEDCVELLRQIVDDGTTPAPTYIVGVTADTTAKAQFDSEFKRLVTQILHVAPGEHDWKESLGALLQFVRRVGDCDSQNDYDICVINALRAPELEAVFKYWPVSITSEHLVAKNVVCRTGSMEIGGISRTVAGAHLSLMGPIAATHATIALLAEYRPKLLMMTGICGGFSDHVSIGDVVVAEMSWDWQAGKWTDSGTLLTASDQRSASPELLAIARRTEELLPSLYSQYSGKKPPSAPRLVVGPMVTGSSVVASPDIQMVFRNQHRKMVGIDMECYGLYYAAENHSGAPTKAICIKAVSDLADRTKSDDYQGYCSYLSAMIALSIVRFVFGNNSKHSITR